MSRVTPIVSDMVSDPALPPMLWGCVDLQVARYCCRDHQVQHWSSHKVVCRHLQNLAAAAAAPAGAT
jgi:hypothetical protein